MVKVSLSVSDMLNLLHVPINNDTEKLVSEVLSFLIYLKPGDELKFASATFTKMDNDLLYVDSPYEGEMVVDSLEKRKVIQLKT